METSIRYCACLLLQYQYSVNPLSIISRNSFNASVYKTELSGLNGSLYWKGRGEESSDMHFGLCSSTQCSDRVYHSLATSILV